jgi:hypothetical protein
LKRILIGFFACFALFAQGDEDIDLYRALVPVPDQTSASRVRGIDDAFEKVLIKLTGNSNVMERPQLQPFLTETKTFLDSVGFGELQDSTTGLDVRFDRNAIDKLLRLSQLPVLPVNRPKLLVWIVMDDIPLGRRFINEAVVQKNQIDQYSNRLLVAFDAAMENRGMPYFMPSYDLEDQLSLSVNQAWSLRTDMLDSASQRYAADGWFAMRFYVTSEGEIRGAWAYQHEGKRLMNDFRGEFLDTLVASTVDDIADSILQLYTYVPQLENDQLLVEIDGVSSFRHYQLALERLKKLELVDSLRLHSVSEDKMVVAVEIKGSADRLHAELLHSGWLKTKISADYRSIGRLTYNWVEQ